MAFHLRLEFWKQAAIVPNCVTLLTEGVALAVEHDEDTTDTVALPVLANREAYTMSVKSLAGAATVTVGASSNATDYTEDRGHLVALGDEAWFLVQPGSYAWIAEYGEPEA